MSVDLPMPTSLPGVKGVPLADEKQTAKDFSSDQEVRWCPGCGDYAVLKAVQSFLPDLGLRRENIELTNKLMDMNKKLEFLARQSLLS